MSLPAATEVPDCTPNNPGQTAESYLNSQRVSNHGGGGNYGDGTADFRFPSDLANDQCALEGRLAIGGQGVTAVKRSSIRLNFLVQHVYLDVGGEGTLTVTRDGVATTIRVSGAPNIYDLISHRPARGA